MAEGYELITEGYTAESPGYTVLSEGYLIVGTDPVVSRLFSPLTKDVSYFTFSSPIVFGTGNFNIKARPVLTNPLTTQVIFGYSSDFKNRLAIFSAGDGSFRMSDDVDLAIPVGTFTPYAGKRVLIETKRSGNGISVYVNGNTTPVATSGIVGSTTLTVDVLCDTGGSKFTPDIMSDLEIDKAGVPIVNSLIDDDLATTSLVANSLAPLGPEELSNVAPFTTTTGIFVGTQSSLSIASEELRVLKAGAATYAIYMKTTLPAGDYIFEVEARQSPSAFVGETGIEVYQFTAPAGVLGVQLGFDNTGYKRLAVPFSVVGTNKEIWTVLKQGNVIGDNAKEQIVRSWALKEVTGGNPVLIATDITESPLYTFTAPVTWDDGAGDTFEDAV